jgi:dihydrofolate reductase
MRDLVYYIATSLDGYIAGPDGETDVFPIEGDHMRTVLTDYADAVPAHVASALALNQPLTTFDTVLMGWKTYQVGVAQGVTNPYPHLRQIVFSRAPRPAVDGVTITAEDPRAVVQRLKAELGAPVWLCGGGELAAALRDEIDRLVLKVNPLVFGSGIPLFGGTRFDPREFTVTTSTTYTSGVLITEYRRA